jgi:ParB family chromosome partitioning protein
VSEEVREKETEERIVLVPLQFIKPLPLNVTAIGREEDEMLRTEMTRIESKGLYKIDPILIRRMTPKEIQEAKQKYPWAKYELIDGHSRFEAAVELGWNQIRAIIIDATREEAYRINYEKNKVRGKVDPLKEAMYFKHLNEDLQLTQDKIAEMFGISQKRVSEIIRRTKVGREARRIIIPRGIMGKPVSGKHLEVIASVPEEKQPVLAETIMEGGLTWREAEKAKEAIEKGLPKEEAVKVAKAPTPPADEIEIGEIECPECHKLFKILHVDVGKHRLKEAKKP